MTPIEMILSRLDMVRPVGPSRWVARCPAHADRRPSLSVSEADDLRVLLHDFAGCEPEAIVRAVRLELRDLFPPHENGRPWKRFAKLEKPPDDPFLVWERTRDDALLKTYREQSQITGLWEGSLKSAHRMGSKAPTGTRREIEDSLVRSYRLEQFAERDLLHWEGLPTDERKKLWEADVAITETGVGIGNG